MSLLQTIAMGVFEIQHITKGSSKKLLCGFRLMSREDEETLQRLVKGVLVASAHQPAAENFLSYYISNG